MTRLFSFALVLLLSGAPGCSSTSSPADSAGPADQVSPEDVGAETGPVCERFKGVGQPCDDECECLGGICALTEYAPFRFCTAKCGDTQPGSPCEPEQGESLFTSLCVEFPSDFLVPPNRFCAPYCNEPLDCAKLGAPWEECIQPHWKGNPLYPAIPDKVCISPSAQGHEPVDPDTCENWEDLFNAFPEERFLCIGYCEFLDACKVLPANISQPCCAFHCSQKMTEEGLRNKDYFKEIRCYVDHYGSFTGTALVCTKPFETCGENPDMP